MEIELRREASKQGATLGNMYVDGLFECFTLEDQVREPDTERPSVWEALCAWVLSWKVPKVTAIPRGRYKIVLTLSPHFGRVLPLLLGVPGYSKVRIHPGNKAADTDGCILVGKSKEANLIYKSKEAFSILYFKVEAALAEGQEVWLTVL